MRVIRLAALLTVVLSVQVASTQGAPPRVGRCVLTNTVDPGSGAYLVECVERAKQERFDALLVRIDTPGGSLESTRQIAKAFLASEVPVLVWVGPAAARAGSAGVFITLASHFAGMAPGTNIGAAHPVMGMGGEDPEKAGKHMAEKIVNDTVAFAESLARQRGRNEEWAAKAVRESASVTAEKAVELKVVEVLAATEADLLDAADGRKVKTAAGEVTLRTRGAQLVELEPSLRQKIVHWLANPAVAYLLFLIAGLGLAIEFSNPGMIVPGLLGAICLVLAMIAFSALPISTGAVILMLIGFGLLIAELFFASGLLAAGGIALLILGGVLFVDRVDPDWFVDPSFRVPLAVILPTVLTIGGSAGYVLVRAAQARKLPQRTGEAGLVGERGKVLAAVDASGGEVFVHGERWRAVSALPIPLGAQVQVEKVDGLLLHVTEVKG